MRKSYLIAVLLMSFSVVWGSEFDLSRLEQTVKTQALKQSKPSPHIACELKQGGVYRLAEESACLKNPQAK